MLKFSENPEYRWVMAFKSSTNNANLIDAAYCVIVESPRFEGKWQSRMNEEESFRCGPSPLIFNERNELRQIARANHFLRETNKMEDGYGYEIPLSSSQPPKQSDGD